MSTFHPFRVRDSATEGAISFDWTATGEGSEFIRKGFVSDRHAEPAVLLAGERAGECFCRGHATAGVEFGFGKNIFPFDE